MLQSRKDVLAVPGAEDLPTCAVVAMTVYPRAQSKGTEQPVHTFRLVCRVSTSLFGVVYTYATKLARPSLHLHPLPITRPLARLTEVSNLTASHVSKSEVFG